MFHRRLYSNCPAFFLAAERSNRWLPASTAALITRELVLLRPASLTLISVHDIRPVNVAIALTASSSFAISTKPCLSTFLLRHRHDFADRTSPIAAKASLIVFRHLIRQVQI
jgi:hypothetical protein